MSTGPALLWHLAGAGGVRPAAPRERLRARRALGRVCRPQDFWFINTCEVLRQHFPCEKGCTVELGSDVPAYVRQQGLPTSQACLVTQQQPQCWGEHAATSRLCACSRA